jgi:hypothetical protein
MPQVPICPVCDEPIDLDEEQYVKRDAEDDPVHLDCYKKQQREERKTTPPPPPPRRPAVKRVPRR